MILECRFDMDEKNLLGHLSWGVFTYGRPPAIDVRVKVKALDFSTCYERTLIFEDEGLKIKTLHLDDLLIAKKSAGRPKDLDDLQNLGFLSF